MSDTPALRLEQVRAALPVLERVIYLNTGTMGISAAPVVEATLVATRMLEAEGLLASGPIRQQQEGARTRIAALLGADTDEITLTNNATDGIAIVASGLAALRGSWLQAGERVLLSSQEHPAMTLPWRYMQQASGIVIDTFEVCHDPAKTLARVEAAITPRTRVIATSHVTSQTGTRIPVREICTLARNHAILSLVDGAQALGQFRVNVREIGCDFYTANGHKWLHGPKGTGMLYIRREVLPYVQPVLIGAGAARYPDWPQMDRLELVTGGRRFEFATRNEAVWTGMHAALDWLEGLGWIVVEQQISKLSTRFKAGLASISGIQVHTPAAWEHSSGLVSCSILGYTPSELYIKLSEVKPLPIRARIVDEFQAIRFALAYFISDDEVERTLDVLCSLSCR